MSGRRDVHVHSLSVSTLLPSLGGLSLNSEDKWQRPAEDTLPQFDDISGYGKRERGADGVVYVKADGSVDVEKLYAYLTKKNEQWVKYYPPKDDSGYWTSFVPIHQDPKNTGPPTHPKPHFMHPEIVQDFKDEDASVREFLNWYGEKLKLGEPIDAAGDGENVKAYKTMYQDLVKEEAKQKSLPPEERNYREAAVLAKNIYPGAKEGNALDSSKKMGTQKKGKAPMDEAQSGKFKQIQEPPGFLPYLYMTKNPDSEKWTPTGATETIYYGPTCKDWQTYITNLSSSGEAEQVQGYQLRKAKTLRTAWLIYLGWINSDSELDQWVRAKKAGADGEAARRDLDAKREARMQKAKDEKKARDKAEEMEQKADTALEALERAKREAELALERDEERAVNREDEEVLFVEQSSDDESVDEGAGGGEKADAANALLNLFKNESAAGGAGPSK